MYLLLIFLPLLSFLTASLFGRYLGRKGSAFITTACIFLTATLSTIAFYEVAIAEANCYIKLGT
jgi:NADH-quinone oxidoreductase subunit L